MMTVIYKVIWRHRNLGCSCDPLVREAWCRKQPRCQAPAYQPRHLALLTPRKLVSPDLLPNWRVLAQAPSNFVQDALLRDCPVKRLLICRDLTQIGTLHSDGSIDKEQATNPLSREEASYGRTLDSDVGEEYSALSANPGGQSKGAGTKVRLPSLCSRKKQLRCMSIRQLPRCGFACVVIISRAAKSALSFHGQPNPL